MQLKGPWDRSITHHVAHADCTEAVDFIDHDQSTFFGTCDTVAFELQRHVQLNLLEQRHVVRHGVVCLSYPPCQSCLSIPVRADSPGVVGKHTGRNF